LSDAELLEVEDADAFAAVYDRHAGAVYEWARWRVGDFAPDVTAEVFARAWLCRRRFRDEANGSALPWLYGIAANVLRDSLRKRAVESAARSKLGLPRELTIDPELEAVERRLSLPATVLALVDGLPDNEREVLRLRVVEERRYKEIATRLSCTPEVARARVSRALRRLQLALGGPLP
jgi:RNA polymerase sigma-70 factor (ECF subfamily)